MARGVFKVIPAGAIVIHAWFLCCWRFNIGGCMTGKLEFDFEIRTLLLLNANREVWKLTLEVERYVGGSPARGRIEGMLLALADAMKSTG